MNTLATEEAGTEAGLHMIKIYSKVKLLTTDKDNNEAAVTLDNNPTFTNTYKAAALEATIKAKSIRR